MSYYMGLAIEGMEGYHLTLAFLGALSKPTLEKVIETIHTHLNDSCFEGVSILLDDEDMFGPNKNIHVRLCHLDDTTKIGQSVFVLAKEVYDQYAKKDYPQNFHISATGKNAAADEMLFKANTLIGSTIFIKKTGTSDHVYCNPPFTIHQ